MGSLFGGNSAPPAPTPPQAGQSYGQGIQNYLKYLPQMLGAEQTARGTLDPARIQEQQALQSQFGPTQYAQMSKAFQQLDPTYYKNRMQLGNQVSSDLSQGYNLAPGQQQQIQQGLRGAQAARGNASGASAGVAEGYALGNTGAQMYQQRLSNANSFLQDPSMAQLSGFIPPVSADRSSAYVDPNAGFQGQQFALQNFQNQLGASQLNSQNAQQGNPWMSTLGSIGQTVGTVAAVAALSDKRVKTDVKKVGKHPSGVDLYEFSYKNPQRFRGVMAQDVQKKDSDAVANTPSGYLAVTKPEYFPEAV